MLKLLPAYLYKESSISSVDASIISFTIQMLL